MQFLVSYVEDSSLTLPVRGFTFFSLCFSVINGAISINGCPSKYPIIVLKIGTYSPKIIDTTYLDMD
jgi:hypothetical protein